jgi:hypothetical protein
MAPDYTVSRSTPNCQRTTTTKNISQKIEGQSYLSVRLSLSSQNVPHFPNIQEARDRGGFGAVSTSGFSPIPAHVHFSSLSSTKIKHARQATTQVATTPALRQLPAKCHLTLSLHGDKRSPCSDGSLHPLTSGQTRTARP